MIVAPVARSPTLARSAAGFMATSTVGASPGVMMSWSAIWTWKAETPARVPAGARISAGKFGSVARSFPKSALPCVKRSPVTCMPSPESPANLTTMFASDCTFIALSSCSVVLTVLAPLPPPASSLRSRRSSRHRDRRIEVHVLHRADDLDALVARALEGLAPEDETHPASPFVDDRRADRLREVVAALRLPPRVDEADAAHVAVDDLPAGQVDRVVARQRRVHERIGPSEAERLE